MTGADLAAEYGAALCATRPADLGPLLAVGVRPETIALVKPAIDRITVAGSVYQPDPHVDSRAFLLPVRVDNPLTPEGADPAETVRAGSIVDLLAIHPGRPRRWALRRASADWLGAIEPQYLDPEPVPIWRTPLDWLLADCIGLVVLSREPMVAYRILTLCVGGIIAEDARHASELRALWPIPRIAVRQAEVRRVG